MNPPFLCFLKDRFDSIFIFQQKKDAKDRDNFAGSTVRIVK